MNITTQTSISLLYFFTSDGALGTVTGSLRTYAYPIYYSALLPPEGAVDSTAKKEASFFAGLFFLANTAGNGQSLFPPAGH